MDNLLNKGRSDLVSVVTSPLGFFALSLLIVEGFLTIVMIFSDVTPHAKLLGMLIGAGLFFLVVLGVWLLVLLKPTNLTFGEHSHLEHEKMLNYGTQEHILTSEEARGQELVRSSQE
jgi:hypothetical protein